VVTRSLGKREHTNRGDQARPKGVAKGALGGSPPIKCCLALLRTNNKRVSKIFILNFNRNMSKMHCFENKFSKNAKPWGLFASSAP